MSLAGLRGVSAEQDGRFRNKEAKLLKQMKFPEEFAIKVDLTRVNWDVMKPWIAQRTTELLGIEDDVLIGYINEQLENAKVVDPRKLQINLTGFLEKSTAVFCKELWSLLASAASSDTGIPQRFLDEKAAEMKARVEEEERIRARLQAERAKRAEEERAQRRSGADRGDRHHGDGRSAAPRPAPDRSPGRRRSRSRSRDRRRRDRSPDDRRRRASSRERRRRHSPNRRRDASDERRRHRSGRRSSPEERDARDRRG